MASMSFTQLSLLPRICRWHLNGNPFPYVNFLRIQDCRVNKKVLMAVSRNKKTEPLAQEMSDIEAKSIEKKTRRTTKRASARTRKKAPESPDENTAANGNAKDDDAVTSSGSTKPLRKTRKTTHKKATPATGTTEEQATEKVTRQRFSNKKADDSDGEGSETEYSDHEGDSLLFSPAMDEENEQELEFDLDDGEDISNTYRGPPLVCCFGATQRAFVPCGRRANRLINYKFYFRMWEPEKFVRAPGGCSGSVAVALARLGSKVAFMGKLGNNAYGKWLLYYLNSNEVQTRSVQLDDKRATAVSRMKIHKRGGLRMTTVKPCAEDCLSKSEIDIDVLKEAKMFYFNTFSLLDPNMRSTALQAIRIAKKLGNVIFYDLNLPLPLWQSREETKMFIKRVWDLSDIIEVTKQELEFLCGITPPQDFDTRNNAEHKFTHYAPEVVSQLWHDNLKVLFVTNGTSKIHYYTKEHNGARLGMEDMDICRYNAEMSVAGDAIVAGLMRRLSFYPELITDKAYLENAIDYAIDSAVYDQLQQTVVLEARFDANTDSNGIESVMETEYLFSLPS